MKIHLLVLAVYCLAVVYSAAVPVKVVEVPTEKSVDQTTAGTVQITSAKPDTRQARQKPASEDDDDDDDDDDLDLDVVDDDDDDDDDDSGPATADDDDDDDDDYFGGLFDDILGDDDDDEEEDEAPAVVQPVVSPAEAILPEEVVAEEEYETATDTAIAEGLDSELENKDPVLVEAPITNTIVVQPVPADEDDDDDDDEDELDELTSDDDDDDDDDAAADDDDDDDDDDDELEALADADDVIEARRSRGLELERDRTAAIYVSKYNRFIDNIIGRVNRILRRSYDPVRVKLNNSSSKKTKSKRKGNTKPSNKSGETSTKIGSTANKSGSAERIKNSHKSSGTANGTLKNVQPRKYINPSDAGRSSLKTAATPRATNGGQQRKPQRKRVKNNKKKSSNKSNQKARATLYGLSSIKREGDVSVNMMADHTTVKTNFALGPLTLRVEKEFGRGQRREIKSATATTAEMHGRLSLRVTNAGNASLHSIKVLQPKQVRVESPDEHDRTREFIWKRSSHIAHLVSQKLAAATRTMLKPSAKSFYNSSTNPLTTVITTLSTPTKSQLQ